MKWTHGYEQSGKAPFSQRREHPYRRFSPFEPGRIRFHILNVDLQGANCFDNHFQSSKVEKRLPAADMNRAATTALDLFYGFYQGLSVNVFLLPPRAAEIKAMTTGGGAVVIGYYSSRL